MTAGERIVAAARGAVGARFRPQGRDPTLGLDCVGVVGVALGGVALPGDYRLRCGRIPEAAVPPGMTNCDGRRPGDVLLCRVSPAQLHLIVRTDTGFVHADAAARRVVERPGEVPWPIAAAWRKEE